MLLSLSFILVLDPLELLSILGSSGLVIHSVVFLNIVVCLLSSVAFCQLDSLEFHLLEVTLVDMFGLFTLLVKIYGSDGLSWVLSLEQCTLRLMAPLC